MTETAETGK